jgi:hypothetical protein
MTSDVFRIYRFENDNGVGAFYSGKISVYVRHSNCRGKTPWDMPCPISDLEKGSALQDYCKNRFDEVFGFFSLDQIKQYFGCVNGRKALYRSGVKCNVYEVREQYIIWGNHQVVFNKEYSTFIGSLDPVTLELVDHRTLDKNVLDLVIDFFCKPKQGTLKNELQS